MQTARAATVADAAAGKRAENRHKTEDGNGAGTRWTGRRRKESYERDQTMRVVSWW